MYRECDYRRQYMASLYTHIPAIAQTLVYSLAPALLLYLVSLSIYRLYFHPLATFPGPKIAALTFWYEFYYDVIKRGQFTFDIVRMHRRYGPIVRINPDELHIADADFYDTLYVGAATRRTDKYYRSARMFGNPGSMISCVSHELHRMRRQPLNGFFSRAAIAKLDPMIKGKIDKLCEHLSHARDTGEVVNLGLLFYSVATDVITEYCFGQSHDFLHSERGEAAAADWSALQKNILEQTLFQRHFGWFLPLMLSIPEWLVLKMKPEMTGFVRYRKETRQQIMKVMADQTADGSSSMPRTVFHDLLDGDIPPEEKTLERLEEEAQTILSAGALTTAHMLAVTTFYLLANPPFLTRLLQELTTVMPNPYTVPSTSELERLPYFSAVINEGSRMSNGIATRLIRVSPDTALPFQEWVIPAGTPVSMTAHIQHADPELFPDPEVFNPDRFLGEGQKLARYVVNFNKGTRKCLGMNLARAEIHGVLASMLARFGAEMELFDTDRSDVDMAHDFFAPYPKLDSKGLRVTLTTDRRPE